MTEKTATKQHILEATIAAIEKHGVQHLTTRRIAEEAGVNNAALHYYYGTKEQLIEEALALSLDHMMADTDEILSQEAPLHDRVRALLAYLIEGCLKFPNLIRAHLAGPLMDGDRRSPLLKVLDRWLERAGAEVARGRSAAAPMDATRIALHTALSAILVASLMPGPPRGPARSELRDPGYREAYLDQLAETALRLRGKGK